MAANDEKFDPTQVPMTVSLPFGALQLFRRLIGQYVPFDSALPLINDMETQVGPQIQAAETKWHTDRAVAAYDERQVSRDTPVKKTKTRK